MIFCNIEEVTELSGKLTEALKCTLDAATREEKEAECCDDSVGGVGEVFRQFADQIRNVYGTYCREQDSASQLLEKV